MPPSTPSPATDAPETTFADLGCSPRLLAAIDRAGFRAPTPVQAAAIPEALRGRDILGLAQTGTGKTAAFALPMLQRLAEHPGRGPRALIVAPTRELAMQINEEIRRFSGKRGPRTVTVFGGVPAGPQIRGLRSRAEIIVACPGRLLDLHRQGHADLSRIEMLILDEADRMFDMGFLPDIRRIIAECPANRQNLLFSATMPREVRQLADELLQDPAVVEMKFSGPAETVAHGLFAVEPDAKTRMLRQLLRKEEVRTAIVFTRTRHRARKLAVQLDGKGLRAAALQGGMNQNQRTRVMEQFRRGRIDVLVATDVAARGIDVSHVTHVINFDIPASAEDYTHRVGRTGRATREGEAWTIVTAEDRRAIADIERAIGQSITRHEHEGLTIDLKPWTPGPSRRKNTARPGKKGPGARHHRSRRPRARNRKSAEL